MMTTSIACLPGLVGLPRREILAVAGRKGARIESRRGSVWVTQDGDLRDVVLAAGEVHVLEHDGPVLVQALDAALVALRPPPPAAVPAPGLWQRLLQSRVSA